MPNDREWKEGEIVTVRVDQLPSCVIKCRVRGIASNGVAVLGRSIIVEMMENLPDASKACYPFTCMVAFENQILESPLYMASRC